MFFAETDFIRFESNGIGHIGGAQDIIDRFPFQDIAHIAERALSARRECIGHRDCVYMLFQKNTSSGNCRLQSNNPKKIKWMRYENYFREAKEEEHGSKPMPDGGNTAKMISGRRTCLFFKLFDHNSADSQNHYNTPLKRKE